MTLTDDPSAEVQVLEIHEETIIERADFFNDIAVDHEAGAAGPGLYRWR